MVEISATLHSVSPRTQRRTVTENLVHARLDGVRLGGNRSPLHYQPVRS